MNNLDNDQIPLSTFALTSKQLEQILEQRNNNGLLSLRQLLDGLQTSIASGIAGDEADIRRRRAAFGTNNVVVSEHQPPSGCTFHELVWEALRNSTFVLLVCCAALSTAIGVRRNGAKQGFRDGAMFFLAIFLSLHFGAVFKVVKAKCVIKKRWWKRRNVGLVKVIRHGEQLQIPASEVVVGEVVCLEPGDEVPADGIFIRKSGGGSKTAVFTGENPAEEGLMVVTAVGKNTEREKLLRQSRKHQNPHSKCSKFECEIENISVVLQRTWLSLSLLMLAVQAVRCFVKKSWCEQNPNPGKGVKNTVEEMMNETTRILEKIGGAGAGNNSGLVSKLCVLLLALGDGLPLGIFITLSYASKKMKKYYGATACKLPACATIGSVTTICATKTGDLELHPTSMADLWIGFKKIKNPTSGEVENCLLDRLRQGILRCKDEDDDSLVFWAENVVGPMDLIEEEEDWKSLPRTMKLERKKEGNILVIHWKGDAKLILSMCSHYHGVDGAMQALDDQQKTHFFNQIPKTSTLRLVAFAYKQLKLQQTEEEDDDGGENINELIMEEDKNGGLVLLGIVALKNPYGVELRHAIESCRKSGVKLKLMVEDNIKTSRIMASHSGLKGAVVKGINMIDESCVFADSSPADQLLLIQRLRQKGEVVASTAGATSVRHLPALQESDVGIFMGEESLKSTKNPDADITINGVNFGKIFEILMFGRHICRNLQTFIELQLTLNITAFTVTFLAQIISNDDEPLTAFQILWVNLVMDTLGAFFLAKSTLENPNFPRILQVLSVVNMNTKINVAIQSLFQVTLLLTLNFLNKRDLIFHCYALLQVFVLIAKILTTAADTGGKSCRRLTLLAFSVLLIFVSLQVAMSEITAAIFHCQKLGFKQWVICVGISFLSVPITYAANLISAIKIMV
ncbi:PREDICTED: calcium-transporting ATPase 12, plasma membrane-type-like [Ipomoea nil]|uniref:calcium-transporting ATPase 12, plasma membrane-type-like n=1 Tax=Ipomoea nil TaxID=35883 RepID=UPI000900F6B7|nr:PREDICTED: calcium-transporting ATPase 12, plasma membrane-type-like [Ipomoea nil]